MNQRNRTKTTSMNIEEMTLTLSVLADTREQAKEEAIRATSEEFDIPAENIEFGEFIDLLTDEEEYFVSTYYQH